MSPCSECAEWKQVAGVEAGLRREFSGKLTEAAAFLDRMADHLSRGDWDDAAAECRALAAQLRDGVRDGDQRRS